MYSVEITSTAKKQLRRIPKPVAKRVITKLTQIAKNPYATNHNVKALKGGEGYRLRVGDYRAVYYLHDDRLVVQVVRIKHRKEIYT